MSFPIGLVGIVGTAALLAGPLLAQQRASRPPATITRALATITESDFRSKLDALAHDSTRGRETPSPELERATAWVADRFRAAGLAPAGDGIGYLQQFHLRHSRLDTLTVATATGNGVTSTWRLVRDFMYAAGGPPVLLERAPLILLSGIPSDTTRPFGDVPLRGAVLLHVITPAQLRGNVLNPLHQRAQAEGVLAHFVVFDLPDERWTGLARGSFPERWEVVGTDARESGRMPVYGVRLAAAAELLRAAGADPAVLTTPAGAGIRPLPGFTVSVTPHATVVAEHSVANVVAVLEGRDPALRGEAVVFTSHMDHVGVIPGRCRRAATMPADSICNGADDNASGTVGLIELAEAYAALATRPARTLVFAAMTAEERGLCGARFHVEHPVVPLDRTAAVINLDMIARNPVDTVGLVGKDYTSLGAVVDRVAATHTELRLTPKEHRGMFAGSDHYPFAQRGVPALFFFSGDHADLHTAADGPDRADAAQAARIVRLAFLVGLEVADAATRPTWEPGARETVVTR